MSAGNDKRVVGRDGDDDKDDENGGITVFDQDEISINFMRDTLKIGSDGREPTWKDTLNQVIASCIVHCIVIQAGVNMAYSTVLIGGLQQTAVNIHTNDNINNDDILLEHGYYQGQRIIMNKDHESWIASLVTITLPIGSLIAGPMMDKFGRKTICIIVCIPVMISWILLILSNSLSMIYAARSIAGISAGLTSVGLVYVIEITHPRVRPMLLCLNSVFVSLGILLTCLFALWLDWQQIAILFLVLNFIIFIGLFAIPESPYWLVCFTNASNAGNDNANRIARAEKSLGWLNPSNFMYEEEYARIKETSQRNRETSSLTKNERSSVSARKSHLCWMLERWKYYTKQLRQPIVYKPLILLSVILLMQQLSGAYVVIFYAISVFREIGGTFGNGLDEYGALLLLGVIRFLMSVLTAHLSRTIGRRVLCIASGLGMAFAMFFSAMFVYLTSVSTDTAMCPYVAGLSISGNQKQQQQQQQQHLDTPLMSIAVSTIAQQKWLLLVIVLFYVCMSTLGFVVIPWTLIGELLPISFRGVGGGLMISFAYIIMFVVVKSYPYALLALGPQNVFFFFSLMSIIATSFVYLFLPETLGKSFKQIENYFMGINMSDDADEKTGEKEENEVNYNEQIKIIGEECKCVV